MRNGFTHFSFGNMQEARKNLVTTLQTMKGIFSAKYWWAIALLICMNSLSFAQTNSEGATPAMTKAGAPAGSYALSGFENVNLFNGNLNFNLPLVKIGGRGKAQSSVNLAINSARWNVQLDPNDSRNSNPGVVKSSSGGYRLAPDLSVAIGNCYELSGAGRQACLQDLAEMAGGGPLINEFNLIDTGMFTAPGSYYRSYTITETNREVPGYSPGILVARKGKLARGTLVRLFFTAANGTEYELRDTYRDGQPYSQTAGGTYSREKVFISPDGAGLRFVSTTDIKDDLVSIDEDDRVSGTLYFPDGTIYEIDNGNVVLIKDANGNKIIYTYSGNKVVNILDSLGRQVRFSYDNEILSNDPAYDPNDAFLKYDKIETQLNSEDWQVIKVYRTKLGKALRSDFLNTLSLSGLFPEFFQAPIPDEYNPSGVVKRVELPDGKTYKLFYTPYNEVARVVLPTGGAYEYDFPMPLPPGSGESNRTIFRPVKERRVYADGGSVVNNDNYNSKQKYVRHAPLGTYPNHDSKVTVEEYSGNVNPSSQNDLPRVFKSDHYFYGLPDSISHTFYPKWNEGREYKTEIFDSTTNLTDYGQLRQRTFTEWKDATQSTWGATKKVQVDSVTSSVFENGKSLTSKTTFGYDNTSLLNNKTHEWISDYGTNGTPGRNLRHSKTYYLKNNPYQNNVDYTSDVINLHGLPEKAELYEVNPNGLDASQPISTSEIRYDEPEYSLLNDGSPSTGWTDPVTAIRGNATTNKVYNISHGGAVETHARFDKLGNPRMTWNANGVMSEVQYSAGLGYAFPTTTVSAKPASYLNNPYGSDENFISTATYDFYTGLVKSVTDANGRTTQTSYINPATGNIDLLLRPRKVTAPNGQQTVFEYGDDPSNLYVKVKTQIDAINWSEATEYFDGLGRKYKTQAKDSAGDIFTETEYDNIGRVKRVTNPYRVGETKLWSETEYDALGRLVETFAPKASGRGDSLGVTSYDLATGGDSIGTAVIGTDAAGRKGRAITNALGQLIRVDEPSSTNTLNPLPTPAPTATPTPTPSPSPTPGGNGGGGNGCDALSDLPCNNYSGGEGNYPSVSTYYRYDALGRMIEVTQGEQKRFFLYDTLGRLLRVRQPEQEINTALPSIGGHPTNSLWTAGFTYDNNGNALTTTDAKGVTTTNTYDQLNRVLTRTYSGEAQGQQTPTVYYSYDGVYYNSDNGKLTAENKVKGALTQVRNGISTSQVTKHDVWGRPAEYQQITDGVTYATKYQYNLLGALEMETYPHGRVVKNEFNQDGDLMRIASKANTNALERTYASNFAYTATGAIAKLKLGNGLWEAAKFNNRLQITELGLGIGTENLNKWKVNYDYGELNSDGTTVNQAKNTGNIAKQTISFQELTNPFVQTYKYDSVNRLTHARETVGTGQNAQQTWQQTFGYDQYGNRTGFYQKIGNDELTLTNKTHPQIDPLTNRFLTSQGYGYDRNGNITSDPTDGTNNSRTFTFDGDNKQTEVKDANGVLIGKYFYDGDGKRVKKQTYDEYGVVKEKTIFVYSGGKLIAEYSTLPLPANSTTNYVATDILQSVRAISNHLGEVTSRRDFMPFGKDLPAGVTNRTESQKYTITGADAVRQKFTGYQKDTETQLDFAEARMYENRHGRFTAVDPLLASGKSANPQTFNRYVYVMNNPLTFTDPAGMQASTNPNEIEDNGQIETVHSTAFDSLADAIKFFRDQGNLFLAQLYSSAPRSFSEVAERSENNYSSKPKSFYQPGSQAIRNEFSSVVGGNKQLMNGVKAIDPIGIADLTEKTTYADLGMVSKTDLAISYGNFAFNATTTVFGGGTTRKVGSESFSLLDDAVRSVDNLYNSIGDDVVFHYTSREGLEGIIKSGEIQAGMKNRVFFTQQMFSPKEAENILFIGSSTHAGRGDFLIGFKANPSIFQPIKRNELFQTGNFKFNSNQVIYAGPNPFKSF